MIHTRDIEDVSLHDSRWTSSHRGQRDPSPLVGQEFVSLILWRSSSTLLAVNIDRYVVILACSSISARTLSYRGRTSSGLAWAHAASRSMAAECLWASSSFSYKKDAMVRYSFLCCLPPGKVLKGDQTNIRCLVCVPEGKMGECQKDVTTDSRSMKGFAFSG